MSTKISWEFLKKKKEQTKNPKQTKTPVLWKPGLA
jgi:hypothetical protein